MPIYRFDVYAQPATALSSSELQIRNMGPNIPFDITDVEQIYLYTVSISNY